MYHRGYWTGTNTSKNRLSSGLGGQHKRGCDPGMQTSWERRPSTTAVILRVQRPAKSGCNLGSEVSTIAVIWQVQRPAKPGCHLGSEASINAVVIRARRPAGGQRPSTTTVIWRVQRPAKPGCHLGLEASTIVVVIRARRLAKTRLSARYGDQHKRSYAEGNMLAMGAPFPTVVFWHDA